MGYSVILGNQVVATNLCCPPSNFVFVGSLTDLPDPVAGVITLEDSYTYYLTSFVDLEGNRLVCGNNTTILGGSSENCGLLSTGLVGEALITSQYSLPVRNISITADVALDLDANGNANAALDWDGVNFLDCGSIGTIANYTNFIFTNGAFLNSSDLTFDGTFGTIGFEGCLFNGAAGQAAITVAPTATVSRRFRIIYSSFVTLAGETSISTTSGSFANPESFILDTVNFSGGGTYLNGLDASDNESLVVNCVGIENSSSVATYFMAGNATPTTFVGTNTYTKILGTTSQGGLLAKFTLANNRATYTGAIQKNFRVTATTNVTGGNNNEICLQIYKNGNPVTGSSFCSTMNAGGRVENVSTFTALTLTQNQYIEIWIANKTSTTSATVTDLQVIVEEI